MPTPFVSVSPDVYRQRRRARRACCSAFSNCDILKSAAFGAASGGRIFCPLIIDSLPLFICPLGGHYYFYSRFYEPLVAAHQLSFAPIKSPRRLALSAAGFIDEPPNRVRAPGPIKY